MAGNISTNSRVSTSIVPYNKDKALKNNQEQKNKAVTLFHAPKSTTITDVTNPSIVNRFLEATISLREHALVFLPKAKSIVYFNNSDKTPFKRGDAPRKTAEIHLVDPNRDGVVEVTQPAINVLRLKATGKMTVADKFVLKFTEYLEKEGLKIKVTIRNIKYSNIPNPEPKVSSRALVLASNPKEKNDTSQVKFKGISDEQNSEIRNFLNTNPEKESLGDVRQKARKILLNHHPDKMQDREVAHEITTTVLGHLEKFK